MSSWALRNSQVHPSHRCECRMCTEQYNMHYRFEWQGVPADAPAGAPRNTHQHDESVSHITPRW